MTTTKTAKTLKSLFADSTALDLDTVDAKTLARACAMDIVRVFSYDDQDGVSRQSVELTGRGERELFGTTCLECGHRSTATHRCQNCGC